MSHAGFLPFILRSKESNEHLPNTQMEAVDMINAEAAASEVTSSKQKDITDAITGKVLDYYSKQHVFDFYNQVRTPGP